MRSRTTSSWSGSPRRLAALLVAGCSASWTPDSPGAAPVDLVDPMVGTGGPGFRVGSSTPAATTPFGLVKLGPDTSLDGLVFGAYHCSGYYHDDDSIDGFSHLHLHGVGVPDYGALLFMPTDGFDASKTKEDGYRQPFSHDDEVATAGRYEVTMGDGIHVELTATPRTGVHRYTFPEGVDPTVVIDLEHILDSASTGGEVYVSPRAGVIEGWLTDAGSFTGGYGGFPVYFHAEVEGGFVQYGTWGDDAPIAYREHASGIDLGAWVKPLANPVTIRVGLSLTSVAGARENLAAERTSDFDAAADAARASWEEHLAPFTIEGADPTAATIFWTSVYHLLQMPTRQSDVDGTYRGFDHALHSGPDFYSDMSLWDTYRTAHPAYTLFYPDYAAAFAQSLLTMRLEGGAFPRWPAASGEGGSMLGAPADIVLADTWIKGVTDWDVATAWPLLVEQGHGRGTIPYNARPDPRLVEGYGYYPSDLVGGSVAWTQELAWADDAMANLATALGDPEEAAYFAHLSYSYVNQYDPATGFFRGRDSSGAFAPELNEIAWLDEYTEGNAWQYLWMPPAHADVTAALFGGEEVARARLTTFFEEADKEGLVIGPGAYYWHGNEPDIHAPFLFSLWGDPHATSTWQRWVEDERYFAAPDGLAGNDDAGTLSAWYIFSTLGFYPIAGTDRYVLGAPRFTRATFRLGDGVFTVVRDGPAHEPGLVVDVVEVTLDGVPVERPYLYHRELRPGGVLTVTVAAR